MEIRNSPTEHQPADDPDLFPVQLRQEGPRLYVSEAPGLGIEVDEERVAAAQVREHWNPPQYRRPDGSVQNW
jgi:galactonate dehydratase